MSVLVDTSELLEALRHKAEHVEGLVALPQQTPAQDPAAPERGASPTAGRGAGRSRRARARAASERVERVGTTAPVADDQLAAWYRRVEDAVLDLSNALPQGTEDYDARKLFEFLVALRRAVDRVGAADRGGEATSREPGAREAAREAVELAAMQMGDVVRRIGRRLLHDELDDPRTAADYVLGALGGVGVGEAARLLGVSTKTIQAWRAGKPVTRNPRRVVLVAQLISYLRPSMTALGVVMWFDAVRHQLRGRAPLELLEEDPATARDALVSLARGSRGQLAD